MVKKHFATLIIASVLVTGCSTAFWNTPPSEEDQVAVIAAASQTAREVCLHVLAEALTRGEIEALNMSLEAVAAFLELPQDGNTADIALKIASLDANVAPFAPTISLAFMYANRQVPEEYRETMGWVLAKEVVLKCQAALQQYLDNEAYKVRKESM